MTANRPRRRTPATPRAPAPHPSLQPIHRLLIFTLLVLSLGLRVYRLDFPPTYVYDEVYHVFTARELLNGNRDVWDVYATPPAGVAYEWTHPPMGKLFMAATMGMLRSDDFWAARLSQAFTGVLAIAVAFRLALILFQNPRPALLAAFVFSLDGLNFVQSRTGMNDIYLVAALMVSLLFLLQRHYAASALLFGIAFATKWNAIYFVPLGGLLLLQQRPPPRILLLALIPPVIYLLSYAPFFAAGNGLSELAALQQQMWGYHTGLKAVHDYASPWWSWPLSLIPVWYSVQYRDDQMANLFAAGNPGVFWMGLVAVAVTAVQAVRVRGRAETIVVAGYAFFLLPYALSPRILFLYHYSPAVPFLCLALGHQLARVGAWNRWALAGALALVVAGFMCVYPFLTGVYLPKEAIQWFFALNRGKNPFAQ